MIKSGKDQPKINWHELIQLWKADGIRNLQLLIFSMFLRKFIWILFQKMFLDFRSSEFYLLKPADDIKNSLSVNLCRNASSWFHSISVTNHEINTRISDRIQCQDLRFVVHVLVYEYSVQSRDLVKRHIEDFPRHLAKSVRPHCQIVNVFHIFFKSPSTIVIENLKH